MAEQIINEEMDFHDIIFDDRCVEENDSGALVMVDGSKIMHLNGTLIWG